jgi:putative transposase
MSKRFHQVHIHLVWATAGRAPLLTTAVNQWLWPALAECARAVGSGFVVVGGVEDHVHVLCELPLTVSIAEMVRRLKGSSGHLLRSKCGLDATWQEGYGVFAVSRDNLPAVETYVRHQEQHHAGRDLQPEFEAFA